MKLLMQLIYYSGIRVVEAIKILTEFDEKKKYTMKKMSHTTILIGSAAIKKPSKHLCPPSLQNS